MQLVLAYFFNKYSILDAFYLIARGLKKAFFMPCTTPLRGAKIYRADFGPLYRALNRDFRI